MVSLDIDANFLSDTDNKSIEISGAVKCLGHVFIDNAMVLLDY